MKNLIIDSQNTFDIYINHLKYHYFIKGESTTPSPRIPIDSLNMTIDAIYVLLLPILKLLNDT